MVLGEVAGLKNGELVIAKVAVIFIAFVFNAMYSNDA